MDRRATEIVDGAKKPLYVSNWDAKKDILVYDFGTLYYTGYEDLRLALSIRNFAPRTRYQLEYFELPLTFTLGIAMNIFAPIMSGEEPHAFTLSVNAVQPRDYSERLQIGGEYWYNDLVALRMGYKFNYDLEGFTVGVGVKKEIGSVIGKIDYAYSDTESIFNAVHRFSFGISF
jgi:hypothetical protein